MNGRYNVGKVHLQVNPEISFIRAKKQKSSESN